MKFIAFELEAKCPHKAISAGIYYNSFNLRSRDKWIFAPMKFHYRILLIKLSVT